VFALIPGTTQDESYVAPSGCMKTGGGAHYQFHVIAEAKLSGK
jgi:hypothetical protein